MDILKTVKDWFDPSEEEEPLETPYPQRVAWDSGEREISVRARTELKVVLVQPRCAQDLPEIAKELRNFTTVIVSAALAERGEARRMLDILAGVAYGLDSRISRIAEDTYMIVPYNVEFEQDALDALNSGAFFAGIAAGAGRG